eukprot:3971279-Pyramimonas_sp.AAC.1
MQTVRESLQRTGRLATVQECEQEGLVAQRLATAYGLLSRPPVAVLAVAIPAVAVAVAVAVPVLFLRVQ